LKDGRKRRKMPRGIWGSKKGMTSAEIEVCKKRMGKEVSGRSNPNYGNKWDERQRRSQSKRMSGKSNFWYGKRRPEHAEKLRGRKYPERGKKIGKSLKLYLEKYPEARIGSNNPFYGKIHSKESGKKMGDSRRGERNPNWQGGASFEPYGEKFDEDLKNYVRDRDDFICQFCGAQKACPADDRQHPIHHISYKKKDNEKRNLLTLCCSCNVKANTNREKWKFCFTVLNEIRHLTYPVGGI